MISSRILRWFSKNSSMLCFLQDISKNKHYHCKNHHFFVVSYTYVLNRIRHLPKFYVLKWYFLRVYSFFTTIKRKNEWNILDVKVENPCSRVHLIVILSLIFWFTITFNSVCTCFFSLLHDNGDRRNNRRGGNSGMTCDTISNTGLYW